MISVTKLRKGVTFEENGQPYKVVEYAHAHMSRGGGTIKVKARNLADGAIKNLTYKSGAEVNDIEVEKKVMQYLYKDEESLMFMNPASFEQVTVPKMVMAEAVPFLREGENVILLFWDDPPSRPPSRKATEGQSEATEGHGKVLGADLPPNVIYEIAATDPGEKGDSAVNVFKPATLTNGLVVKVPLFIKVGDKVRVDTRTREYVERVK